MSSNDYFSSRIVMHRFCEPYFHAIRRWMLYTDATIFQNRIEVMAMIVKILNDRERATVTFGLIAEHFEIELLDKVIPIAGATYTTGADIAAFKEAGRLVEKAVFQSAGLYFQNNILKALAVSIENGKESEGRRSALAAVEILFRLSEDAGCATLTALFKVGPGETHAGEVVLDPLTGDSLKLSSALYRGMAQFQHDMSSQDSQSSSGSQQRQGGYRTPSPSSTFTYPTSFPSSSTVRIVPLSTDQRPRVNKEDIIEAISDTVNDSKNCTGNNSNYIKKDDGNKDSNLKTEEQVARARKTGGKGPAPDSGVNKISDMMACSSSRIFNKDKNEIVFIKNEDTLRVGDSETKQMKSVLGVNVRSIYGSEGDKSVLTDPKERTNKSDSRGRRSNKTKIIQNSKQIVENDKNGNLQEKKIVGKRNEIKSENNDNKITKSNNNIASPARTRRSKISETSIPVTEINSGSANKRNIVDKTKIKLESCKKQKVEEEEKKNAAAKTVWTTEHSSVGTIVSGIFQSSNGRKIFHGTVVKYSECTDKRLKDELYHILWQDGDEQDWDRTELKNGMELKSTEEYENKIKKKNSDFLELMSKKLSC